MKWTIAALLLSACAPTTDWPPSADLAHSGDMSPADLTTANDLAAPGPVVDDLATATDLLAAADLEDKPPDLTSPPDLAVVPDLANVPDLASVSDLAASPDLLIPPDLTVLPDLTVMPDLTVLPDLRPVPDLATVRDLAIALDMATTPDLSSGTSDLSAASVSFANDVLPILQANCINACHMTTQWDNAPFSSTNAALINYWETTSVSHCGGTTTFIRASDSTNSFIYEKVSGNFAAMCGSDTGSTMPPFGPLPSAQITTIRRWIDQGALNN